MKDTKQIRHYTLKMYHLEYFGSREKKGAHDYYYKTYVVHSGYCKLAWVLKFNSLQKLKAQLKLWYPNEYYISFRTNINDIIKGQNHLNRDKYLVLFCEETPFEDRIVVNLKDRKVKSKNSRKKRAFYYDDMYDSVLLNMHKKIYSEKDLKLFNEC